MIDDDGALALLAAIVTRWWRDAHHDSGEVLAIASFLEIDESELRRRFAGPTLPDAKQRLCRTCGQGITTWRGNGRPREYCSEGCKEKSRA